MRTSPIIFPSGTFEAHRNILAEHDLAQHSMVDWTLVAVARERVVL